MLDQRQRRWADVVQMLYKCFVLAKIFDVLRDTLLKNFVIYFTVVYPKSDLPSFFPEEFHVNQRFSGFWFLITSRFLELVFLYLFIS